MTSEIGLPNWFEFVKTNFSILPMNLELVVLQIGVYKGDCTEYLLKHHKIQSIVDVDTWEGSMEHSTFNFSFERVEEIYDVRFSGDIRVKKKKMTSDLYFATHESDQRFDFIYIDGAHTSLQVLKDGINSFARLKVGGLLAFDDYDWPKYVGTLNNPKIGINLWLKLFDGYFELVTRNYQVWIKKLRDF